MEGKLETFDVVTRITRADRTVITIGVHTLRGGAYDMDGLYAPALDVRISRSLSQSGGASVALPGLRYGEVGEPWHRMVRLGDTVEIDAVVQRTPDPDGTLSSDWRNLFFGRVKDIDADLVKDGDGFTWVTTLVCDDLMGTLNQNHFTYWRNLGATFAGSGMDPGALDKLKRLQKLSLSEADTTSNSVAGSARVLFEAFISSRLMFSRTFVETDRATRKTSSKTLFFDQMYGYRFESDEQGTTLDLRQLAPESSTWKQAVESVIDAPQFYEFYMDSIPRSEIKRTLPTGDDVGVTSSGQVYTQAPELRLLGDYAEVFVVRPTPFPQYRAKSEGYAERYTDAAWESLPLYRALEDSALSDDLKQHLTRDHIFSVFSADLTGTGISGQDDTMTQSSSNAQVVGDIERLMLVSGVNPLDATTKRLASGASGSDKGVNYAPELSRRLAWQLFSFNHFNDIALSATSSGPLDLRLQLGSRYLIDDTLFYLEGYTHGFTEDRAVTSVTLSRGLPVEMYGIEPVNRPRNQDDWLYVSRYLGRKRPGETYAPVAGQAIMDAMANEAGEEQ